MQEEATSTYRPKFHSILYRGFTDPWFLILVPLAVLIFLILIGYHVGDPGWTHSGSNPEVRHFFDKIGAYSADVLLSFLGYAAYLLPLGFLATAWASAKDERGSGEIVLWKSIGLVGAVLSLSGILTFHWQSGINSVAITGGGILGQKMSGELLKMMPIFLLMLMYTLIFLVALTLMFNLRWLSILAVIGYFPAKVLQAAMATKAAYQQEREQPTPNPEQSQAQRETISSRLQGEPSIVPSSHVTAKASPAAISAEEATQDMTLAERMALLSSPQPPKEMPERPTEIVDNQPVAAENIESPLHRSEPGLSLNWADYKKQTATIPHAHTSDESARTSEAVKQETAPIQTYTSPETPKAAPIINPHTAASNPFAAYDAFQEEKTIVNQPVVTENSTAVDEDFFEIEDKAESVTIDTATVAAEAENNDKKQTEDGSVLRIRASALASNFQSQAADSDYQLPSLALLKISPPKRTPDSASQFRLLAPLVESALQNYKLDVRVVGVDVGPVVTRLELELAPGIKVNQISNLDKDLARSLSVSSVRVVEVIPGKPYVGLEIPNKQREIVHLRDILESATYQKERSPLTVVLGSDIAGAPKVADLAKMPHLLVAGTTGSGKSVAINVMLASMLFKATPDELKLILIDPKMLEMSMYEDIPHLLTPVVTDMNDAENALRWAVAEMERRYLLMSAFKVRNIIGFNDMIRDKQARGERIDDPLWRAEDHLGLANQPPQIEPLPYIVIVIDELADMMMAVGKKVEELIARIAQKARAAGIHLVLATQRPSVDVITGLIKANVPTRLAFQVSSKIDSRTIIDGQGAETLLGHGDGLYVPPGSSAPLRVHGAFIEDGEVDALTAYLKTQGKPQYEESITNPVPASSLGAFGAQEKSDDPEQDPLYDEACQIVLESGKTSISYLQRRLQIGYNRAARIIEAMEAAGLLSMADNNGSRKLIGGGQQDY